MKANTIKLEEPLLKRLNLIKPSQLSLAAFVRSLLDQSIKRVQMLKAAQNYQKFLAENEDEQVWLDDWQKINLIKSPKRKK